LIEKAADLFGSQCIVISIDTKKINGKYKVFYKSGTINTGMNPVDVAKKAEKYGAGEILINSIDNDGSKKGFDIPIIDEIINNVKIPVICCGGAHTPQHFMDVLKLNISGIAASNMFHYTEQSVVLMKSYLRKYKNYDVRLDSYENYEDFDFDQFGRIIKREENYLENLRFEFIEPENI